MKKLLTLTVLLALSLSTLPALGGADLSKITFGKHVTGPEGITKDDFAGRIVIVEYWGINCPPCIAQIPHITKLAKEYGHDKLLVIASHVQGGSIDQVKEKWESRAKSEHVIVQQQTRVPGFGGGGIPRAVMFDQQGKEIWTGHPASIDKPLKDAMKNFRAVRKPKITESLEPIVTGVEAKYFKRELAAINAQSRKFDSTLRGISVKMERTTREDQIAEGQAILDAVEAWAKSRFNAVQSVAETDPTDAYALIDKSLELLGSHAFGKDLQAYKQTMESDKALMDVVRSTRMLREVKALAQEIGLAGEEADKFDARKHSRSLSKIDRDLRRIAKAWPETESGQEAASLLKAWELQ